MAYCRYSEQNLTPYSGNSARNLKSFSVMFFRKTRKMSADVQAYFKRNLTPYSGDSAPNLSSFFGDVFSQNKASKPPLYIHTARRKKRSITREAQPETSNHFSVMFFSQDKASKPPLYMHTARRKKRRIAEKQPEKSDFHNVGFLFLCHIVNFFNVFVGYLLNLILTVVELVFGYSFIFVELF
jgi:hypothetical protein